MVSLSQAKAQLGALIDRVIAGEDIVLTRRGRAVARLSALEVPRRPVDIAALQAVTAGIPLQPESAAVFIRAMRDDERY